MESSSSYRIQQLETIATEQVARILLEDLDNPNLKHVRITHVRLTPDLSLARVNFEIVPLEGNPDPEDIRKALNAFKASKGLVKNILGPRLNWKRMPDVKFYYDDTAAEQRRVDALFQLLKK